MKKIYIKTLSLVSFALMANVAVGQNLIVTSDGKPVKNGDVIELPYEFEEISMPEYNNLYEATYTWDPQLYISSEAGEEDIAITVKSIGETDGFQICWPMQCYFIKPGASVSTSGSIDDTPAYISLHKEKKFYTAGETLTESDLGSILVTIDSESETVEFTIKTLLADKNGVDGIFNDSNAPTLYFTLEGIQVENPTNGIYVAKKGSKAKLIYKK